MKAVWIMWCQIVKLLSVNGFEIQCVVLQDYAKLQPGDSLHKRE